MPLEAQVSNLDAAFTFFCISVFTAYGALVYLILAICPRRSK